LFVAESLVFGLIGAAIGIGLGQIGAGAMARGATRLVQGVYGVGGFEVNVALTLPIVALAVAVGLLTSALAAAVPARAAAHVDPVKALQKGGREVFPARYGRRSTIAAAIVGTVGVALVASSHTLPVFYAGYLCSLAAALLLTPMLTLALTRAIRPLLCWLRPVEGALAADSLIAAPKRTAATVVALMLSIALVIGLAGNARAAYSGIAEWVNTSLNPDLFVTSGATLTDRNYRFPDSMTGELESVDGVGEVQRVRNARVQMDGEPVLLISVEVEKAMRSSPRRALQGNLQDMTREAAAGRGAIGSENFASLRHLRVGDRLRLPSPYGVVEIPLVGIIRDYGDQQGALFIDHSLYTSRWHDDSVDFFRLYVRKGASPQAVKETILQRFKDNRRIFVLENAEVRRYVGSLTDQWFTMSYAQLAVAIIVAILGIVNSMTVSVTDRRRELGILRAVGGFRTQVRWTIWMEAIGLGLVSLVLGLAIGGLQLFGQLEMTARDFPGLRFDYMYPYGVAAALVPTMIVAALLGAIAPAEAAVRGSLVEALEYE
jgi:putative ABC transport system permease protein